MSITTQRGAISGTVPRPSPDVAGDVPGRLSGPDIHGLSFRAVNASTLVGVPAVGAGLERVEPALLESVTSGDAFLDQVTTHLIEAGGKRLRPLLTLAAATGCVREATDDDVMGGVAVELVHQASLYHDDVIDEAVMRRQVESVNTRWGNLVAIVAGDFLLARSAEIAASLGQEIAALLANTLARLCEGQLIEIRSKFSPDRTDSDYFATIAGKTAALLATSCRVGTLTAKRSRDEVEALTRYGHAFGMVFQIRDDILDVIGSEKDLGKPTGQDLAEGVYTLPVLLALGDRSAGPKLRSILGGPLEADQIGEARGIVSSSGAVEAAISVGSRYVDEACQALVEVGNVELTRGLSDLSRTLMDDLVVAAAL